MSALRIEVICDHEALVALGPEWDALVERAGVEHPFLSHDWVCSWWESFGAGKQLHVLAVRCAAELIGLAPLMRTRTRMYGLPMWRLESIANVHTPRFDFVIAERADEVYAAILGYLEGQLLPWDVLMLAELPERSRTDPALKRLAETRSLRSGVWLAGASPRIQLPSGFDAFYATLSSKRRAVLRQRIRRLERLGAVTLDLVTDPDRVASALEDGLRIEAASWKGAVGTAIALHQDLKRFYVSVAERAARSATLQLLFLKVGERRIAFAYGLRRGRTLFLLKTGYDPEYAAYSPFHALLFFAIQAACRDGLDAIDLLGNEEPWKRDWTEGRTERRWFFLCRNSIRGFLVHFLKFVLLPALRGKRRQLAAGADSPATAATAASPIGNEP